MATINAVRLKRTGFSTDLALSFKYGLVVKDILNQDLNTGTLILVKTNELDIEPFDIIEITYETTKKLHFYVGTVAQKITKFGTTKQYQYEIGLVSLTVKLQRIILPNRSITKSLDGTADKTIKTVIENYLEIYAPEYTLSTPLIQKLGSIKAQEFQWNRPQLFEVLNDLLKPLGAVITVTLSNTNALILDYLDLDEEGNAIDQTKIHNTEIRHDMREYSSDVEIDAQNVYNKDSVTHTPESYGAKTVEQVLITSNNQSIVLQKPIFDVKKVLVSFHNGTTAANQTQYTVDITNRVVNKKVWDTFFPSNSAVKIQDTATVKYKRNYLFFEEGKNVIDLTFKEDDWLGILTGDHSNINNTVYWTLKDNGQNTLANAIQNDFNGLLYKEIVFKVEYLTTDNILFKVSKDNQPRNKSVLISSQESSIINSESFGNKQQEFINRIGNREMIITGRYDNYNDIPDLKDYINNFVLVEREIQIHESHYNFKGTMSEFYSKENMFAGINSERKYFSVADPNEASISNHLTEIKMTLSNNDEANASFLGQTENYIIENFGKKDKYIQGALVLTDETQTETPSGQPKNEILLETTAHPIGKSVIVTMQMQDNFNSHHSAVRNGNTGYSNFIPYVDSNGRFEKIKIHLYRYDPVYSNRGISIKPYYVTDPAPDATNNNETYFEAGTLVSDKLPEVSYQSSFARNDAQGNAYTDTYNIINTASRIYQSGTSSDNYIKRYKDNREITYETLQFNFGTSVSGNGSTQEIFITNLFVKFTPFIFNESQDYTNFKIAYSNTLRYNRDSKTYKGTLISPTAVTISRSNNELSIIDLFGSSTWSNVKNDAVSYAICDNDGNIIIAVNKLGAGNGLASTYEPLYLNR